MKRILITGANSYIGTSFESYINQFDGYEIDTLDMIDERWREKSFEKYDVVFHVAGIAHQNETSKNRNIYYRVNYEIAVDTAKKAKSDGVGHFIVLSTMSVYGLLTGHIKKQTECNPLNAYGKSKFLADKELKAMNCDSFKVAILRPPMVYGKGCKGNYQQLRCFALKSPIFPSYKNERSMIYIDNLCEFVKCVIDNKKNGIFFPQNKDYVCTCEMVKLIAECNGKKILCFPFLSPFIKVIPLGILKKVFGSLTYEKTDLVDKVSFVDSIRFTEG